MKCPRCHAKSLVIRTVRLDHKTVRIRRCCKCSLEFSTVEIPDKTREQLA